MIFRQKKIRGSAMGYAISFLLLTGLITSGVLFIASANKRIERNFSVAEHLVFDNYFSLQYGANQQDEKVIRLVHPAGDSSLITVRKWGVFRMVQAQTYHGRKSINRTAIVADRYQEVLPAIYLPNSKQNLKVCGSTLIEGNAAIPEKGIERAYISGKNYEREKLLYGNSAVSEKGLPELKQSLKNIQFTDFLENTDRLEWTNQDSVFSFQQKTTVISSLEPITIRQRLEGNLVIHSFDSIFVSAAARLENVILIAPSIHFEKGFRGTLQAIATKHVVCEEDVSLLYPSAIVLNEVEKHDVSDPQSIELKQGSRLLGGILLESQQPNFRNPVKLYLEEALVGGFIYNQGTTELVRSKIIGHVYTQQFDIHAGGGHYINHLLDVVISSEQLPEVFIVPEWIQSNQKADPEILACY